MKHLIILFLVSLPMMGFGQNESKKMELKISDYKLEGRNNYDHKAEGKTVVQNLLLQCFLNNQMGRKPEFFNDMYNLTINELKKTGYSFYWPNDINSDFSMREIDEHNSRILKDIIRVNGFPEYTSLSELEVKSIFLVLYYSNDIDFINKYKSKFLQFYQNHKFPSKYYAFLTDKLDYINSDQQTYGTFLILDENGTKTPQMIKKKNELDKRRNEIGLESYEKWMRSDEYRNIGERTRIRESWYRDHYNKMKTTKTN